MSGVKRVFVEKKKPFAVNAKELLRGDRRNILE